jgi:hypothetical protein
VVGEVKVIVTGFSRSPGGVGSATALGAPITPLPVLAAAAVPRTGPASASRAGSLMARLKRAAASPVGSMR